MVPSLIIICLGCSPILPIMIFFLSPFKRSLNIKSTRHGILSLLYLFYYFCFFRSSPISRHRATSGVIFFFKDPPPRKNSRWRLWRHALSTNQNPSFFLAPKLKSTNQNPDFKPPKVTWLKRHHYYWSRILLTMLFSPVFGDTGGGDIWKSQWRGESLLSFFLFDYQLWYFASYYPQQRNVKCAMSYFCRCISKTKLFKNWSRFTHNLRKEMCGICH